MNWMYEQFEKLLALSDEEKRLIDEDEMEHPVQVTYRKHFSVPTIRVLEVDLSRPEFAGVDYNEWSCPYEGQEYDNMWCEYTTEFFGSELQSTDFWEALFASQFDVDAIHEESLVSLKVYQYEVVRLHAALDGKSDDENFPNAPDEVQEKIHNLLSTMFDESGPAFSSFNFWSRIEVSEPLIEWLSHFPVWENEYYSSLSYNQLTQ